MNDVRTYALVDASGLVDNIILWDGNDGWIAPAGLSAVLCPEQVGPGWTRRGDDWLPPLSPPDE
ncbi:hypothetical protein [Oryzibacter oryziterrae]|uniref:hypothetical protein n=1 Tax=Oryzibacter oryziterrae TaxID=2766474 RepID=UPI001F3DCC4A|nr:hypothetical protein [Oryzibacter oryziterrae]